MPAGFPPSFQWVASPSRRVTALPAADPSHAGSAPMADPSPRAAAHARLAAAPGPPADGRRGRAPGAPSPARNARPCGTPPSTPAGPCPTDDLRGTARRRPYTASSNVSANPSRKPGRRWPPGGAHLTPRAPASPELARGGSVLVSKGGSIQASGEAHAWWAPEARARRPASACPVPAWRSPRPARPRWCREGRRTPTPEPPAVPGRQGQSRMLGSWSGSRRRCSAYHAGSHGRLGVVNG